MARRWLVAIVVAVVATSCSRGDDLAFETRGTAPIAPSTTSSAPTSTTTAPPPPPTSTTTAAPGRATPRRTPPATSAPVPTTVPAPSRCATATPPAPGWLFTAEALAMPRPGELWVAGWGHPVVQVEGASSDPPAVGVTRDGGATWESLCWPDRWPPNGVGRAVAFRSSLGFVVGQFDGAPFVLRTADGGQSWVYVAVPNPARLQGGANCGPADVAIVDDTDVWIATGVGVYHSGDAGRSFTRAGPAGDAACTYSRLAAVDADHVWLTGINRMARTNDGGATWTETDQPLPVPGHAVVNDVAFVDRTHGFVATSATDGASGSRALLFATDDGGATWRRTLETDGTFRSLDFVDHDQGFLAGGTPARGEIWATTDGGTTWERRAALDSRDVQVVDFTDPQRGYGTISNRPCIIATIDGGRTWTKTPVAGPSLHPCEPDP